MLKKFQPSGSASIGRGQRCPPGRSTSIPLPMSDRTPAVNVLRAIDLIRLTVSLPASMSTPDSR